MPFLLNSARMSTATTGTGTVTLGSAVSGYASFATAGAVNARRYSYTIEDGTDFEHGYGTYTSSGTTFSRDRMLFSSTGSLLNLSGSAQIYISSLAEDFPGPPLIRGYITGLTLSNNGTDATNDIDIAAGAAVDSTNVEWLDLTSALTKRLDAAWAVGSGNGGLDTGSVATYDTTSATSITIGTGSKGPFTVDASKGFTAGQPIYVWSAANPTVNYMYGVVASYSGTSLTVTVERIGGSGTLTDWVISAVVPYHAHAIKRLDTGVVDVLFSLSATAPTLPTNYTLFRRIGTVMREAPYSNALSTAGLVPFDQFGDFFKRRQQSIISAYTAAVSNTLLYAHVPTGIKVRPLLIADCQLSVAGQCIQLLSDGDRSDANESVNRTAALEYAVNVGTGHWVTNTAGQLRFKILNSSGTISLARLQTQGWIDGRGQ
jgi:hypothetical protein